MWSYLRCATLYASLYISVATPLVIVHADNRSTESGEATETQHATCRIVTDKLVATASATVTRALEGVCTTEELEKHYMNLENSINYKIEPIKIMLLKMEQQLAELHKVIIKENEDSEFRGPRGAEISQNNYTLHTDISGNQVFSYFWKVERITSKISRQDQHVTFRSPSFYINNGYRMYIKLYPHQNKGDVYIHVGLTKGRYDELLAWPFKLRHRVTILDQTRGSAEDIASRVWDPTTLCSPQHWLTPTRSPDSEECVAFGITKTTILSQHYVFDDCLLIKLDIFIP